MKIKIRIIADEFFQISLITYLILLIAETLKEGFVSYFFNINILLFVVIGSGIVMVLTDDERWHRKEKKNLTINDWQFFIILSIAGGLLVYFKTQDLGPFSLLITLLSSIMIFLLSYLVMTEE